uniref:Inosine/uridine-preferring nucleoside hydrolase domain-containing protein n=1 Tax=Megaselia scalaris TaxID=36166 RepID=T1GZ31_MEGSC
IPIYKGCANSIIPKAKIKTDDLYYGKDGFGDIYQKIDTSELIEPLHAANAMYNLAKKYPKEITFISVGPLTNLALCMTLYPDFVDLIKDIAIMGGNLSL